ncbi:MAG: hypothetical protein FWH57_10505, partial [Oscillospiraceae bacterium]|nr:hypothetical protein [Oscillospiraceae bacterium]
NAVRSRSEVDTPLSLSCLKWVWVSWRQVHTQVVKIQATLDIPAISYLEYTMLYTNFINRRYITEVWVYGDKGYLDKNQYMLGEYDISFLFIYFDELWDKLLTARKG